MWSTDFVADNLFDGRKPRMLSVVACCSRESLAIQVGQSPDRQGIGEDVASILSRIMAERGQPQTIKSDNGGEFISKVMDNGLEREAFNWTSAS